MLYMLIFGISVLLLNSYGDMSSLEVHRQNFNRTRQNFKRTKTGVVKFTQLILAQFNYMKG